MAVVVNFGDQFLGSVDFSSLFLDAGVQGVTLVCAVDLGVELAIQVTDQLLGLVLVEESPFLNFLRVDVNGGIVSLGF